ncbi:acetyl-/propionyl-CoA carboxylase beta subunit [Nocardia nova SH22a]|uniref:Acetyl-/propionyl-CoA carboxylase beta subunit n=1 Tax=Nocardia nova SH22a TaxID=1415166 RepID=W5T995_9NOCA|nr:acyl-CoA carboxylase subunit beta [Nocardia nova]AHH15880.1 acetyl-/propionyl-CoA carboxylase beta subunit [Nocardia nova SH22a]
MYRAVAELTELRQSVVNSSAEATARQHDQGKSTARERIEMLLDKGSFQEVESLRRGRGAGFAMAQRRPHTDGVVTGWGTVYGRTVFVYAQDFRILGGALGEAHAAKIHKVMDLAMATGAPLVALNDSAGARIQEGVTALAGFGGIFRRNARASGVIPQLSVMLGPCAGGAAYSPALTDFVFMVRGIAQMFLTGPDVIAAVTGEKVTMEELGGTEVHTRGSGLAHFAYDDEQTCLHDVRLLLSMLPSNSREQPPAAPCTDPADRRNDALYDLVPVDGNRPYDMHAVIEEIVDDGILFEVQDQWASNVVCAFARLDGQVVGIVASQPNALAGALDIAASEKAARFVQTCDCFNIALVTLVDVPGFLPGVGQEHGGVIRHGAKLLSAYCNATVPRISLVLRKAFGGAYIVMDSRSIGADLALAWPTNEIAVMGADGAVEVVCRKELKTAEDPGTLREERIRQYRDELVHPYFAAELGLVDEVIDPADTRSALIRGLAMLRTKHADLPLRKHGNPPL